MLAEMVDLFPVPELNIQTLKKADVYEPPQDEIEERLADIWSETLKVSYVGRNDCFFELGGDSLLATSILHKIQDVFGVELPLRVIFELQTIKAIAEVIDNVYIETIGDRIEETVI
jgi:acyl carrier protein